MEKRPFSVFEPPFGALTGQRTMFILAQWKARMDFLLVLIKLFARCYRWSATSEYRL